MPDKALKRLYVHNDHWARCLDFYAIGLISFVVHNWILGGIIMCGAVYHFARWRQLVRLADRAEENANG